MRHTREEWRRGHANDLNKYLRDTRHHHRRQNIQCIPRSHAEADRLGARTDSRSRDHLVADRLMNLRQKAKRNKTGQETVKEHGQSTAGLEYSRHQRRPGTYISRPSYPSTKCPKTSEPGLSSHQRRRKPANTRRDQEENNGSRTVPTLESEENDESWLEEEPMELEEVREQGDLMDERGCPQCSFKTHYRSALSRHIKSCCKPGKQIRNCPECGLKVSRLDALQRHLKLKHADSAKADQLKQKKDPEFTGLAVLTKPLSEIQAEWKKLGAKNSEKPETKPEEVISVEGNVKQTEKEPKPASCEETNNLTETEAAANFISEWLKDTQVEPLPELDFYSELDLMEVEINEVKQDLQGNTLEERMDTTVTTPRPMNVKLQDQATSAEGKPEESLKEEILSQSDQTSEEDKADAGRDQTAEAEQEYNSNWIMKESSLLDNRWYTLNGIYLQPPVKPIAQVWKYIKQEEVWNNGNLYLWKGTLHTETEECDIWETCEPYLVRADQEKSQADADLPEFKELTLETGQPRNIPDRTGTTTSLTSTEEVPDPDRRTLEERAAEIPCLQAALMGLRRQDSGVDLDQLGTSPNSSRDSIITIPEDPTYKLTTYTDYEEIKRARNRIPQVLQACPKISRLPSETKELLLYLLTLPKGQRPRRWYAPPGPENRLELHLVWDLPRVISEPFVQ